MTETIKIEELRIGNLVSVNGQIGKVDAISYNPKGRSHLSVEGIGLIGVDQAEPIPLTDDWYIKFEYECLQELIVDMSCKSLYPVEEDIHSWAMEITRLKVHELQNLFQTLTGEEL